MDQTRLTTSTARRSHLQFQEFQFKSPVRALRYASPAFMALAAPMEWVSKHNTVVAWRAQSERRLLPGRDTYLGRHGCACATWGNVLRAGDSVGLVKFTHTRRRHVSHSLGASVWLVPRHARRIGPVTARQAGVFWAARDASDVAHAWNWNALVPPPVGRVRGRSATRLCKAGSGAGGVKLFCETFVHGGTSGSVSGSFNLVALPARLRVPVSHARACLRAIRSLGSSLADRIVLRRCRCRSGRRFVRRTYEESLLLVLEQFRSGQVQVSFSVTVCWFFHPQARPKAKGQSTDGYKHDDQEKSECLTHSFLINESR